MNPFFAILIPTYRRHTGTYHLLERCLTKIKKQTFDNWKVFLIGDDYRPNSEFLELKNLLPENKVFFMNLDVSPERTLYTGRDLWCVCALTALTIGYEEIKTQEIPVICLSNDDDWWYPDHLETLYKGYEQGASFVYTKSTYRNQVLPKDEDNLPKKYNLIFSAASWKIFDIPLFFRNNVAEKMPGDADLWERIRNYCIQNNKKSLYIPKLTVRHDYEHDHGKPGEEIEYFDPKLL